MKFSAFYVEWLYKTQVNSRYPCGNPYWLFLWESSDGKGFQAGW